MASTHQEYQYHFNFVKTFVQWHKISRYLFRLNPSNELYVGANRVRGMERKGFLVREHQLDGNRAKICHTHCYPGIGNYFDKPMILIKTIQKRMLKEKIRLETYGESRADQRAWQCWATPSTVQISHR